MADGPDDWRDQVDRINAELREVKARLAALERPSRPPPPPRPPRTGPLAYRDEGHVATARELGTWPHADQRVDCDPPGFEGSGMVGRRWSEVHTPGYLAALEALYLVRLDEANRTDARDLGGHPKADRVRRDLYCIRGWRARLNARLAKTRPDTTTTKGHHR